MITENGLSLIKYFEGCKLTAYQDTGGICTIGYGSTKNVHSGLTVTQEEANARLLNDLDDAEKRVYSFVHIELQQCELDSLISQAYNIKRFPMLAGHLNECRETYLMKLLLYCHDALGHELLGLKKRRYAEQQLFQGILWNDIFPQLDGIK